MPKVSWNLWWHISGCQEDFHAWLESNSIEMHKLVTCLLSCNEKYAEIGAELYLFHSKQ